MKPKVIVSAEPLGTLRLYTQDTELLDSAWGNLRENLLATPGVYRALFDCTPGAEVVLIQVDPTFNRDELFRSIRLVAERTLLAEQKGVAL